MKLSPYIWNKKTTPAIKDTLERLRVTASVSSKEWFDLLQLSWTEYQNIKLGNLKPNEKLIERVAKHFNLKTDAVMCGEINYRSLSLSFDTGSHAMPEVYSKAAYGRKRTSITSIDFLEEYVGWGLRHDAIRKLSVSERMLQDPFAPISMKFITGLCDYLHLRQFQPTDFFAMGSYTYEANKNSLIARLFSGLKTPKEAYEFFFTDCMKLFEQNCKYTITEINDNSLTVEYYTNPNVAAESGVRHLGSVHVCQLNCGHAAVILRYLGLPMAKVKTKSEVATAEQIATLIRIYRSAVTSGDHSLRRATAQQLALRGIQTADLAIGPKGGKS